MAKKPVLAKDKYSIVVPSLNSCVICGSTYGHIHTHEIFFGTANRQKSIEDGLVMPLCGSHHNMSSSGIHFNKQLDDYWKKQGEKIWIKTYSNKEDGIRDFIRRYGINYLDQEDLD